jgi:hypothetical protein
LDDSLLLFVEHHESKPKAGEDKLSERLSQQTHVHAARHGKIQHAVRFGFRQDGAINIVLPHRLLEIAAWFNAG